MTSVVSSFTTDPYSWRHHVRLYTSTGWAKKVSYDTFSISLPNINQFLHLFTCRLWKKFATQWRAHHTHYVATLPCKI